MASRPITRRNIPDPDGTIIQSRKYRLDGSFAAPFAIYATDITAVLISLLNIRALKLVQATENRY